MSQLTELLEAKHKKKEFSCGKDMLDKYFHEQANQDVKKKLSACFVKEDSDTGLVQGYYTLSNSSIPKDLIPFDIQKKLPPAYTSIPVTLLGRLAVDGRFHGKGLSKLLLLDALYRSFDLSKKIGSFAVVVDPLDNEAEDFYSKYGFIKLPDSGKMFLAMKTIEQLFQ
jgi:predicted GNAT family N-acyltransferase